jgi:hypothetical protein
MSDRQDNPPSHPRRRAVVPPFLPPRSGGIERPVRPSIAGRRGSTPPFAPQTRQAFVAPSAPPEPERHVEELANDDFDAPADIVGTAGHALHEAVAAESTEPIELTDWLEDDDVAAAGHTDAQEQSDDVLVESSAVLEAEQVEVEAVEPAAEWPKETWHGDPWSDPGAAGAPAVAEEQPIDTAAPVTPFEFAAEFPEPEAFATSSPPLAAPDSVPEVASRAEAAPPAEFQEEERTPRPAWVPPTVEPIAESSDLLSRYATRPGSNESQALDQLKEIEPWAMPSTAPSATSAEDAIAAALERIARRVRDGEVVLPPETMSTTDEAALALTLAALLRTPPKG